MNRGQIQAQITHVGRARTDARIGLARVATERLEGCAEAARHGQIVAHFAVADLLFERHVDVARERGGARTAQHDPLHAFELG